MLSSTKPTRSHASLAIAVPREPRRGVAVADGHAAVAGARGRHANEMVRFTKAYPAHTPHLPLQFRGSPGAV